MTDRDFEAKLTELVQKINDLPAEHREGLEKLAAQTRERHDRTRKALGDMQGALDHLRLSVKYLVFDLEATRRENDYLRKAAEGTNDNDPF